MNEVKQPKKPLIVFYAIVLALLLAVNLFVLPALVQGSVKEVDYGTFMTATEEGKIDEVQIDSRQILYTLKGEKQVYKTGLMNDPGLTERLYASGATFSFTNSWSGKDTTAFLPDFSRRASKSSYDSSLPVSLYPRAYSICTHFGFAQSPLAVGFFATASTRQSPLLPGISASWTNTSL
jgi:hypothetical protein